MSGQRKKFLNEGASVADQYVEYVCQRGASRLGRGFRERYVDCGLPGGVYLDGPHVAFRIHPHSVR